MKMHLCDHIYFCTENEPYVDIVCHPTRKFCNNNTRFLHILFPFFQASGGYNGLSNIKMEDGMTPSIPSMKVSQDLYFFVSTLSSNIGIQ